MVVSDMIMIFMVVVIMISCDFFSLLVICLVSVENRKYGRMKMVGVNVVYSLSFFFGMVMNSNMLMIVCWYMLLLNVLSVCMMKNGRKWCWCSRVNWL